MGGGGSEIALGCAYPERNKPNKADATLRCHVLGLGQEDWRGKFDQMDTVTVSISLPINGTPLERAQAIMAAMHTEKNPKATYALGQLLSDMRVENPMLPIEMPIIGPA